MSNNYLTPKETTDLITELSITKAKMSVKKRFLLSIMAGMFIALGGQAFLMLFDNIFMRAAVFPIGLMLIVLLGGELFTGNCLIVLGCLNKKIKISEFISSILQVFIGNFIGAIIISFMVFGAGMYDEGTTLYNAINSVANSKVSLTFTETLIKGILCNILVASGVWFAFTAKDTTSKILGCWFPVMIFVLCGYEHCVANMFFLPLAFLTSGNITILNIFFFFIPSTIGNFIGGGLILPIVYYFAYYRLK